MTYDWRYRVKGINKKIDIQKLKWVKINISKHIILRKAIKKKCCQDIENSPIKKERRRDKDTNVK